MFNYSKIPRNLYRTSMNYARAIANKYKGIIVYITEKTNSLSQLFSVNEKSLSESIDVKQSLYVIAKKDTSNITPHLSGFNLNNSIKDNFYYQDRRDNVTHKSLLSGFNLNNSIKDNFYYQDRRDNVTYKSLLSGFNTEVKGVSSVTNGIAVVDQNSIVVTALFMVSASNTEVFGTEASFSGITAVISNKVVTLNTITSGSNTESSGLSSNSLGITNIPIDTIPYLLSLSGSNTERAGLSSDSPTINRSPEDTIPYLLSLSGSNTESFGLSSVDLDITLAPSDISLNNFHLSGSNTEILSAYSLGDNIVIPEIENAYPKNSLSGINLLYSNLSTGNSLISSRNHQHVEDVYPKNSLSGINLLYSNLSTGNSLISSRNHQHVEDVYPKNSLSGINLLYSNLSTGNSLISSRNHQHVEDVYPKNSLSLIYSLSGNYLVRPIRYSDPDADAYISAVETQDGQPLEIGVKNSITEFVAELKKAGLWGSISDCLILAGAKTLNGALIPLKGPNPTPSGFNSLNYNRKFLKGNGTAFLNLNRINNFYSTTSHHILVFKSDLSTNNQYVFGDGFGTSDRFINILSNGQTQHRNTSVFIPTGNWGNGIFGVNRASSTAYSVRFVSGTQTISRNVATTPSKPLFLFKAGNSAASNAGISFYSQGASLDLVAYQNIVNRLIYNLNAYTA